MKEPNVGFDRTAQSREWQVECANVVRLDGGDNVA